MIVESLIKAAAVGGIALLWVDFTFKTIKISKQILFPPKQIHLSRCEYCGIFFPTGIHSQRWVLTQAIYVCDDCAKKKKSCVKNAMVVFPMTQDLGLHEILCRFCRDI